MEKIILVYPIVTVYSRAEEIYPHKLDKYPLTFDNPFPLKRGTVSIAVTDKYSQPVETGRIYFLEGNMQDQGMLKGTNCEKGVGVSSNYRV